MFSQEFIQSEEDFIVKGKTHPFILERPFGLDIDTPEDLTFARAVFDQIQTIEWKADDRVSSALETRVPAVALIGGGPMAIECLNLLDKLNATGRCRLMGIAATHQIPAYNMMLKQHARLLGVDTEIEPTKLLQSGLDICLSVG